MEETKQTTPTAPKKVRRVGRFAFALLLIAAGVLLLIQQFVPHFDLLSIAKFAPVLLIVLGIEMLVYSARSDVQLKFDWLSLVGCAFILCVVGGASVIPLFWGYVSPAREYAQSHYQSMLQNQFYTALTADPELKAKVRNLQVYVDFNHTSSGDYTLEEVDDVYVYVELPENGYPDAVSFASDCRRIAQLCQQAGIPADRYDFNSEDNTSNGSSFSLNFLASFADGLSDEQLAQRVSSYYSYDDTSYTSKANRDNAAKADLREQVLQEYEDAHEGEYPGDEYLNQEVENRFNALFPAAPEAPAAPATPESAA